MSLFTTHAWQPVTLGPRILRAETAAIAAIAIAAHRGKKKAVAHPTAQPLTSYYEPS
jgi:hypothetical protein